MTLAFALATTVIAWIAWRRNPMFSTRSTLQFFAAVGVTFGAFIAAMVWVVDRTSTLSTPIALGAPAAVVLAGTISMIALIVVMTDPIASRLSPSAPRVHTNRVFARRWTVRSAVGLGALAVLSVVIPGNAHYAVLTFAAIFAFIDIVALAAFWLVAERQDRMLSALTSSPWVHWPAADGLPEVTFGDDGMLSEGTLTLWLTPQAYLISATMDAGPPKAVAFRFMTVSPGLGLVESVRRVVVPDKRGSDISVLRDKLAARCPKAVLAFA